MAILTPAAQRAASAVRRVNIVSGTADAAVDVRKACNGIKRLASLAGATAMGGLEPHAAVRAAEDMAHGVLVAIGFDVKNEARVASVMPMLLEATSQVVAEIVRSGASHSLRGSIQAGVDAMAAVAKSRAVAKMVEPMWPADIDATTAMRISTAAAMAVVAVEVEAFDYMHAPADCIKEAAKVLVKACSEAAHEIAPERSSGAARLMLMQSLMHSAGRLYAVVWKGAALQMSSELDALGQPERDARLASMATSPLAPQLATVNRRFHEMFSAVNAAAVQSFEPLAQQPVGSPRHRSHP